MEHRVAAPPASREAQLTVAVRDMVLGSEHLTRLAGGREEVDGFLERIENIWLHGAGKARHIEHGRAGERPGDEQLEHDRRALADPDGPRRGQVGAD